MRVTGGWGDVTRSEAAPGLQRLNSTALSDLERSAQPCPTPTTTQSLTGSEERQASILGCCAEQAGGLASSQWSEAHCPSSSTVWEEGRKEEHCPSQHRSVLAKLRVHLSRFKVCPSFLPLPQQTSAWFALPIAHSSLGNASLFPWQPIPGNFFSFFFFSSFGGGVSRQERSLRVSLAGLQLTL